MEFMQFLAETFGPEVALVFAVVLAMRWHFHQELTETRAQNSALHNDLTEARAQIASLSAEFARMEERAKYLSEALEYARQRENNGDRAPQGFVG